MNINGMVQKTSDARIVVLLMSIVYLSACHSGDHVTSLSISLAPDPTAVAIGTTSNQTSASSNQTSATSPSMSEFPRLYPLFNTSIHDYIVRCAGYPSVEFIANLPLDSSLEFVGALTAPSTHSVGGMLLQKVVLKPGDRFQFFWSGSQDGYSVRCVPSDFPVLTAVGAEQSISGYREREGSMPEAQWYVFSPDLTPNSKIAAASSYVIITDVHGTPVWWKHEPLGLAIDAKMLGSAQVAWAIASQGYYVIHDLAGNSVQTTINNLDDHDLQPTPQGTFLGIRTVYRNCPPDCADMSPWGGAAQAAVLDAEILEFDLDGNILWTWKTRDHIGLNETGLSPWFPSVGNDIIHMNSVAADGNDGILISARHLNAVYRVIKSTGAVDWKIGGVPRPESIAVVGDVRPTALGPSAQPLSGQHDFRRWPDGTVSVHDNGTLANRSPFVVRYRIDATSRTAEVVQEFSDSRVSFSGCCGSARLLPNGHWLVQWGEQPFFTELDAHAAPVLSIRSFASMSFSYRAVPITEGIVSAESLRSGMDAMVSEMN